MSIVSLELRDYQSHALTSLELGRLTIIVGSSSAGKSSVLRALTTLVNNSRGVPYVRHGAKVARVAVTLSGSEPVADAQTHVVIERGKGVSAYELVLPGPDSLKFTKCATTTPEAVTAALEFGGASDTGLWLAGQFDRPYLLDETGSQVARVLGHLTGVSLIFAASRECARRASAAKATLKERREELSVVTEAVQRHRDLPQRRAACEVAERALVAAQRLSARRAHLGESVSSLQQARCRVEVAGGARRRIPDVSSLLAVSRRHAALTTVSAELRTAQQLRAEVTVAAGPPLSVALSVTRAQQAAARREHLRELLAEARTLVARLPVLRSRVAGLTQEVTASRAALVAALSAAGSCPVCGAETEHQHLDRVG